MKKLFPLLLRSTAILLFAVLAFAPSARAAITVQATANTVWIGGTTPGLTTFTFTPGTDGMLVAMVAGEGNIDVTSVTWNGIPMTKAVNPPGVAYAHIYYLANPAVGSGTLSVTLNANPTRTCVGALYATGVGALESFAKATSTLSGNLTAGPIMATAGALVIDTAGHSAGAFTGGGIVGGGDTLLYSSLTFAPGTGSGGGASYLISAGGGSYRAQWNQGTAQNESVAIASFAAAGAAQMRSFGLPGNDALISGTNIALTVPFGTDVTALAPTYTLSPGAACGKASGSSQNFTTPQTYSVTEGAVTRDYIVTVTVAPFAIDADVGGPANAGSTVDNGDGTLTIRGGGNDIWNNSDQFFYHYQSVTGLSWNAVMRVHDLQGPDHWTKAMLMVRFPDPAVGTPQGGDLHISASTTRAGGENWLFGAYRNSRNGGSGDYRPDVRPAYPNTWLRVERFGSTFNLYLGTDGVNWTKYRTYNTSTTADGFSGTPWPDPILVGVAVTAHNDGSAFLGAATISDLSVTLNPVTPPSVLTVTKQVQNTSAYVGTEVSFSFAVSDNANPQGLYFPSYQWYKNNQLVTNATGQNFTFLAWAGDDGAQVYCQASYPAFPSVTPLNSATGTVTTVAGSVMYTNGLKVELFRGASRVGVEAGNTGPTVPNRITALDIPGGFGDNYAQRVSGWFKAPTSGNYTFYVASDDDADVFLSTDSSAANKRVIAHENGWSQYQRYTTHADGNNQNPVDVAQKCSDTWQPDPANPVTPSPYATGIPLAAGNLYYLEAVMHQGGGGDNLSVTYRMFENTTEVVDFMPTKLNVTNDNIVLITSPTTNLVWTATPTNTTVFEGQNAIFRSLAYSDTELAVVYQWYRNNAPIGGATSPNYSLSTAALDNGAQFFVVANTQEGGLSITSSVVTLSVQQSVFEPGYVKVEFWQGANRTTIENGTAGDPTYVTTSPAFEASINNDSGANFGRRLSGFIVPATSGLYDFFVNSDDSSDLFVSTSASAANKYLVAQETGWSDPRRWVSSGGGSILSQKRSDTWSTTAGGVAPYAAGIQLTAGQKYYMEAVETEGGGGDNVGATMKLHGAADPIDNMPSVLTGSLIGMNAIRCGYVAFTQQPSAAVAPPMGTATFSAVGVSDSTLSVGVIGDPRPLVLAPVYVIYQWFKNGVAIPGAVSGTYVTPPLLPTDNGAQFVCKIRALGYADAALNPIWSNSVTATVTISPPAVWEPGFARVEYWAGRNRNDVETGVAGTPTYVTAVAQFAVSPDVGDNYARRFSAFFMPPATDTYVLWINADDDSDLFLNPTSDAPGGKQLVAQESGASGSLLWLDNGANKKSFSFVDPVTGTMPWASGIPLTVGQKYYLEGVHHEGGGGDHFEATFTTFNDAGAMANLAPVTLRGTNIGMYAPKCSFVAFTQQPQDVTAISLLPASFSAAGTSDSTLSVSPNGPPTLNNFMVYQWYKNAVAIPGATAATLTIPQVLPADDGAQIVCAIRALGYGDAGGNALWSNSTPATLTVTTVPATLKYAAYVVNTNQGPTVAYVTLAFDKSMNVGTLLTAANYTLAGGLAKTGVITVNSNNNRQVAITVTGTFAPGATITLNNLVDAAAQPVASGMVASVNAIPLTTSDVGTPGVDPIFPTMLWVDGARDYTIVAEGSDFWNNADGGNLSWELKTGNFDVVTRVKSVTYTSTWAKGGLMARDTLDAGSRNWNIVCDPTPGANAIEANSRVALNGASAGFDGARPAPAYPNAWVGLMRNGNVMTAYYSTNGVNWTLTGTQDATLVGDLAPLPATMYVGLCVTAHNNDTPGVEPYIYWNQVDFADYNSSFVPAVPVTLSAVIVGNNVNVTRTPNAGQLYSSPVLGPGAVWTLAPAGNPAVIPIAPGQNQFFKVMP